MAWLDPCRGAELGFVHGVVAAPASRLAHRGTNYGAVTRAAPTRGIGHPITSCCPTRASWCCAGPPKTPQAAKTCLCRGAPGSPPRSAPTSAGGTGVALGVPDQHEQSKHPALSHSARGRSPAVPPKKAAEPPLPDAGGKLPPPAAALLRCVPPRRSAAPLSPVPGSGEQINIHHQGAEHMEYE